MNVDRSTLRSAVGRDAVRAVAKLLLGAVGVVVTLWLVSLLPGIDRVVPLTPVTLVAVASAVATLVVVALLLFAAPKVARLVRVALDGPRRVVEHVASIAYWLVVLAAVLVAHGGLAGLAAPLLGGLAWVYDAAFLLLALPPVVFVVARLTVTVDPLADLIAGVVAGGEAEATGDGAPSDGASGLDVASEDGDGDEADVSTDG